MISSRAPVALLVVTATIWAARVLPAQVTPSDTGKTTGPPVLAGALLGSAGGLVAGIVAGRWTTEHLGWNRGGDDPGFTAEFLGGIAGSMIGASLGAHLGARARGQRVSFGRRLRDAIGGTLIGLSVAIGVSTFASERQPGIIAFSLTQGLFIGLSNGRW